MGRMIRRLFCTKCEHDEAEREGDELHCTCGNVNVDGVSARWPIVEKEVVKKDPNYAENDASTAVNPANNISKDLHSPMQVAERIADKIQNSEMLEPVKPAIIENQEDKMGTKKCSIEGCEKKAWTDGLCAKHYTKIHGAPYKPKSQHAGRKTKAEKRTETNSLKPETDQPQAETVQGKTETGRRSSGSAGPSMGPHIIIPCNEQILETLKAQAEKDFRSIEQQAAYYIHEGLTRAGV